MKKWRNLSLSLKLLASFVAAIFVFSVFHIITYYRLLDTMNKDAQINANERMTSATARLDEGFRYVQNAYFALTYTPAFRKASRSVVPSDYELVELSNQAILNLGYDDKIYTYAILFRGSDEVVTANGVYPDEKFFTRHYVSEKYSAAFLRQENLTSFSHRTYPTAAFSISNPIFDDQTKELMPVAFKSYWNSNTMVLLFLDMRAICQQADLLLTEDFYIFHTEDGKLLYSSEETPAIQSLPEQKDAFIEMPEGSYIIQQRSAYTGFTYIKLLPRNIVVGQITSSLYFTLTIAFVAFVLGLGIVILSVWRLTHPVRAILQLFSDGVPKNGGTRDELHCIQENVEQILRQREQYVEQLTLKDSALSGFLLQSQLKNIYVELHAPDQTASADEKTFYIIYLRIHYRRGALEHIDTEPPAVAYMFLETLQQVLNLLFDTALVFQLESNQFVAKVSLPSDRQDIEEQMKYLLQRLDNESEFAFFTVVQSPPLEAGGDFTAVYRQVLDAAQYSRVKAQTQLLNLPMDTTGFTSFSFSAEQEQYLKVLIREGQSEKAQTLAESIIHENLSRGIRRIHLHLLCSAIASTALLVLSELEPSGSGIPGSNSSGVLNQLPFCDTEQDYLELVAAFVGQAALAASQCGRGDDPVLDGVLTFLEKNYQREFSMDELSDALHLSKSYLSTYYKGKTGNNLSDSIQFFRIQKAIELLNKKDLRIGDVGRLAGISNSNTFLRQFKKYTGMTPKEYRIRKLLIF